MITSPDSKSPTPEYLTKHLHWYFQHGSGVEEILWFAVTERPDVHPNMVALLRKTLSMLKSYNPYNTAEEVLQETESEISG